MKEIRWLHFSDLHVGCTSYGWMWPTIKKSFFEDLQRQHVESGPWDLVIFTGDLTFSGCEFQELEDVLTEVWTFFRNLGSNPQLVTIPGNHDLIRPSRLSAISKALGTWQNDPDLRQAFWETDNNEYRVFINSAFQNYERWKKETQIPLAPYTAGLIPGDFSASLSYNDSKLGIIGLNTAFLQMSDDLGHGHLSLHQRQVHELLGGNYTDWFSNHDFNLLISHHDAQWLDREAREVFSSTIYPPDSFSVHLCGHVHESISTHTSESGASPRLTLKAPSLFGPEKWGKIHERIHGYTVGTFFINTESKGIRLWPRKLIRKHAGHYKIEVDQGYETVENAVTFSLRSPLNVEVLPTDALVNVLPGAISPPPTSSFFSGSLPRFPIFEERHHLVVRLAEQESLREALETSRCAWITADWGMGKDGFLRSVLSKISSSAKPAMVDFLRLPCEEVNNIDDLLSLIEECCNVPLQELCHRFSESKLFLLLDNLSPELTGSKRLNGLENVFETILDYSPSFFIIAISRLRVPNTNFPRIELKPLDTPEVRTYILSHPKNAHGELDGHFVEKVYSISQGFPLYIDVFLKILGVSSLDDIYDLDIDLSLESMESEEKIPKALKCAVSALKAATDDYTKRSFDLLKLLSVLANGETLNKIKRFNNSKPFHALNVTTLVDLSLLDVIPIRTQTKDVSPKALPYAEHEVNNLLRAPRQVRDYVRSLLSEDEIFEINKVAADILFGQEWRQGKIRMSGTNFFKSNGVKPIEIGNEHIVAKTLIVHAIKTNDDFLLSQASLLGRSYCNLLFKENRYKDGMMAAEELAYFLSQTNKSNDLSYIKFTLAKCLRMIEKRDQAMEILHELINLHSKDLQKDDLASANLNIALIKEKDGEREEAIAAARTVQKLSNKGDSTYNQAASIIICCSKDNKSGYSELKQLESKTRNKKQHAVANNICLQLSITADPEEKLSLLDKVINSDGDDYYNKVRAIVARVNFLASPEHLSKITKKDCYNISIAYTYLFSQRFSTLFNICHEAIWKLLIHDGQHDKLLKLFRHSSFLWRIRGDFENEKEYINKLQNLSLGPVSTLKNEYRYFCSRLSSISGSLR
ncbi:MAG: metallophosphoesterase [Geobacter sp.]|nr:metallophosphoesterase [Geobacter sp.]